MRYAISTILIFAAFLYGCQSSQPSGQKKSLSARINLQDEPHALDPRIARDLLSVNVVRMLFEGLTRVGKDEKAQLALAESYSVSDDLKCYTFHLKDTKWSNKQALTAHDFVYTWKKTLDPLFPSDVASHLYVIKNAQAAKEGKVSVDTIGVRALDDKTLQIELEYPVPYLLELLAMPAFFAVNAKVDQANPQWAQNPSSFVSNGPFKLEQWMHHDRINVNKNALYWDASAVQLNEVNMLMISADTGLKMFEKHELDWTGSPLSTIPVESIHSLREQHILKSKPILGTYFIRVNTESFPLNHPLLRKAFAMAIHRKDIVDHVTQGNQIPATGLVPLSLGLQDEPYFSDGDVIEARKLFNEALAELQLDRAAFPEVKLMYSASERNHLIAQAIEAQWRKAFDIQVKLESNEFKIYFDRLSHGDYQLAAGSWIADFNDPINFLDVFRYKKACSNNTYWENPHYAELLHLSQTANDPDRRVELLKQSEKLLIEEMPILPIFYFTMLYVQQPQLQDVILSSMGLVDFKWASISQDPISVLIAEGGK